MADLPTNFTDATQTDGEVHAGAHNDANVKINRLVNNAMTEVERDALAGEDLYNGRIIFNETNQQIEVYDGAATAWRTIGAPRIGTIAARPTADGSHGWYYATDRHAVYLDVGVWKHVHTLIDDTWRMPDLSSLDTTLTYTSGDLTKVEYFGAGPTLRADETLTYAGGAGTGGNLETVTRRFFSTDGTTLIRTVTETLTYTGDDLTSTSKAVA